LKLTATTTLNDPLPDFDPGNSKKTFWAYLGIQKKLIITASITSTACFILLKYCFPYPDFFVDSLSYINWAFFNTDVAFRPTSYSFFLRGIHALSAIPLFLIAIQYLLFFFSTLLCFLSVDYLFSIPEKIKRLLLIILLINPMLIFQANLISSDSLFCSLTVIWFTLCLWIMRKPGWPALLLQIIVLYCSFSLRYAALWYPIIAVAAFILCTAKWWYKLAGIALTITVILYVINHIKNVNEQETGTRVFSGFGGWQIANNALYCYKKINIDEYDLPSRKSKEIIEMVNEFIDSVSSPTDEIGVVYLWDKHSPLKLYCYKTVFEIKNNYFKTWFHVSRDLNEYGWYIVRNFPKEFIRYYVLPNTVNYFYPDPEALTNYNNANLPLPAETKEWCSLDIDHVDCRFPDLQKNVIVIYPTLSLLLNIFNIVTILFFLVKAMPARKKLPVGIWQLFLLWGLFYFTFMAFTIFAAAVNLRFMDTMFVLGLIFPFILLNAVSKINNKQIL
jgi:hypothetical protein